MEKKIYNRTFWVDHETPVNAENLNKIEKGIQELSEVSLRPSDFIQKEGSPISVDINCGKLYFDLDSTVVRGDESVKRLRVIREDQGIDEVESDLCIYIYNLDEEEKNYRIFYGGVEYKNLPKEIKSNIIICNNGELIEDFIHSETTKTIDSVEMMIKDVESEYEQNLIILETKLQNKIDSLQKKLNTLSIKVDMLSDKLKEMEDKNNGLEIM